MATQISAPASEPPWLVAARRELGVDEAPGTANNSRVLAYYRDAGHPEIAHDSVAWCAAFASAMLERSGIASPRTLRARDFLRWGEELSAPRYGCVVVLWRGHPGSSQGHVGFYAGTRGNHVVLLGGNQGDAVSLAVFPPAQILGYRWPGPSAPRSEPSGFDTALAHVLAQEGGWSDDPFDHGGPTNQGITLAELARWNGVSLTSDTLADLRAQLRGIDAQTVRRIYAANYWQPACCPQLPSAIALFHFDAAVNQGTGRAARFLQAALNVEVDGEIGPVTLAATARADPAAVIEAYATLRRAHYRGLSHFWRFGRGWLNRVDATREAALSLVGSTAPPPQIPRTPPPRKDPAPMSTTIQNPGAPEPKWWGHSMTLWGVALTALTTVLPIAARAFGIDLPAPLLQDLGTQIAATLQAIGGLAGIVVTILGRIRASQPLNLAPMPPPAPPPFRARDWKNEGQ